VRRRLAAVLPLSLGLVLLAWPAAQAEYLGSDLVGNVAPESRLGGGLVDRYPLSAYGLDYHVDVGVTDMDGVPPTIAQWAAAQLWSVTSFLVKAVVDLFTWAFSLDLLGGADGALAPVGEAIGSIYEHVIGEAWMVAAILIAGLWGIWKALVQRRYTETAGALALSVLCVLIALFFVYQPERTVGEASRWTNTLSWRSCPAPTAARSTTPSRPSARSPTTCSTRSSTSRGWCSSSAGCATAWTPIASTRTATHAQWAHTTRPATSAATT